MVEKAFVASATLQVSLMAAAIAAVFFLVVTRVEKNLMKRQAEFVAQSLTSSIVSMLPADATNAIANGMTLPGPSPDDAKVEAANAALRKKALVYVGAFTLSGIAAFYFLSRDLSPEHTRAIVRNALAMTATVAATEIAFSTLFAQTYIYADPNVVRHAALVQLQQGLAGQ